VFTCKTEFHRVRSVALLYLYDGDFDQRSRWTIEAMCSTSVLFDNCCYQCINSTVQLIAAIDWRFPPLAKFVRVRPLVHWFVR